VNTQPWTLEHRRYAVSLRTMLAHPAGSNSWHQIPQVLDEITEVYPDVWNLNAHIRKPGGRVQLASYSLSHFKLLGSMPTARVPRASEARKTRDNRARREGVDT